MSTLRFHIPQGLNLRFAGAPERGQPQPKETTQVAQVALDFQGVKPDVQIEVGQRVAAGEVLWRDRTRPKVCFCAPASGQVTAIHRGAKRRLISVTLERSDAAGKAFSQPGDEADAVRAWLLETGLWTAVKTRPFGTIPQVEDEPLALFVTAVEGDPLAPDPIDVMAWYVDAFAAGLDVLGKATPAPVVLCTAPGADIASVPDRVRRAEFSGSHAAALPGTHIDRIAPVGWRGDGLDGQAWHIGYADVIAIGHAFLSGRLWGERVVALSGPLVTRPRLLRVPLGASVSELVAGELKPGPVRLLAGGALGGRAVFGAQGYLAANHALVTALAENLPAHQGGTALGGRPGPLLPTPELHRAWPFDIPLVALMRALSVGDDETFMALGGLALIEEDVAALTFACPSKTEYGVLLRRALDRLAKAEAGA